MDTYDPKAIEGKWQAVWAKTGLYTTAKKSGKKTFVLDMFPYPSGEGLHVGHPKGYIATDIYARHKRMQGDAVLHPMGWDAFGLPAENYAIKNKVHPRAAVEKNIATFKQQLSVIGFDYDWEREINTTDPTYYKWTQWIFLQLYKKGLAYQSNEPINWCPSCMTGLANEDLDGAVCERCGSTVEKRALPQWVLAITKYADRMLADLDTLHWPAHVKEAQRNWIGRSEGAEITFTVEFAKEGTQPGKIPVFTTRPDTLFGATYFVLSPEHPWVTLACDDDHHVLTNKEEVLAYVKSAAQKDEIERTANKEKTGVELKGVWAINPATKERIPIYVADYCLANYGTGALMGVPAHDERDFEFAKKFGIEIREVVVPFSTEVKPEGQFTGTGVLTNSGDFTGQSSEEAKVTITQFVGGELKSTYKLRDWVFSRQRYWGEPIPIIHCKVDGAVAVPEKDLPVLLPEVDSYEPSGTGESPLANIEAWVNTTCPTCGGPAKRETNTMPQWAGSSWYYLRFMDPHNTEALVDKHIEKEWAPVDVYVGGDHAVRHLIYARFWHKFLYDIGTVSTIEPFARLEFLGFILAEDGRKMSKRYGNVINPTDVVEQFGADAFRVYEMFMGPFENTTVWSTASINGTARFIERVWKAQALVTETANPKLDALLAQTILKVTSDIESFKFNTAVSQMMIFLNAIEDQKTIGKAQWESFLKVLAPFAPHITEELWIGGGNTESIHISKWPEAELAALQNETVTIGVQVNGKVRGTITLAKNAPEEEALSLARSEESVAKWLAEGREVQAKYVPGRIVSFVVEK